MCLMPGSQSVFDASWILGYKGSAQARRGQQQVLAHVAMDAATTSAPRWLGSPVARQKGSLTNRAGQPGADTLQTSTA